MNAHGEGRGGGGGEPRPDSEPEPDSEPGRDGEPGPDGEPEAEGAPEPEGASEPEGAAGAEGASQSEGAAGAEGASQSEGAAGAEGASEAEGAAGAGAGPASVARIGRRLRRARVLYENVPKRRVTWLLLKDVVNSCMEYRVLGLAAEAAFFTLISIPPLLLALIGLLGYLDHWIGTDTIASVRQNSLSASATVLSDRGVDQLARPLIDDVIKGGRPDVISIGFAISLWSGSRAVAVFIDTITVMYGLDGQRGIVKTRLLSFLLYIVALLIGAVALPLMVAGPDAVLRLVPQTHWLVTVFYWPVVLLLSIAFLTTLYHVSVPVRSPWREDIPGALVALVMWVAGSALLRFYISDTVEGPTVYGSLAAPVAVLLWIGVSAYAVLVGAAVNAAIDHVWPSVATATARRLTERAREDAAAAILAAARARNAMRSAESTGGDDPADPPAEFPERWTKFLPPGELRARLRSRRRR